MFVLYTGEQRMDLTFNNSEFEYMIDKIMAFQTEESTAFWSQPLFYFYPQLEL